MTNAFDPQAAARRLLDARRGIPTLSADVQPPDRHGAYAIQDATVAQLGTVGGWKVGAKSVEAKPGSAPLPAAGFFETGALRFQPMRTRRTLRW